MIGRSRLYCEFSHVAKSRDPGGAFALAFVNLAVDEHHLDSQC